MKNHLLPANEEEAIQALMKNGGVNKAGSLFCLGVSVVNCHVVLETLRRTKEQQVKEKEDKGRARKVADDGKLNSGLEAFGKWCGDGTTSQKRRAIHLGVHRLQKKYCVFYANKLLIAKFQIL